MIRVYHSPLSRSMRVLWLLEELGVAHEVVPVEFDKAVLESDEHRARHPLGQLPVIEDGGLTLYESGAILQHIVEHHDGERMLPERGSDARSLCWQWFHFGEASMSKHIGEIVRNKLTKPEPQRNAAMLEEARGRFGETLDVFERELGDRPYMLGEALTLADFMVAYPIMLARAIGELPDERSTSRGYLGRLRERPAFVKATQ